MGFRPTRLLVAAAYGLTLIAGICMMPIALLARQVGLTLPLGRVVRRLGDVYDRDA